MDAELLYSIVGILGFIGVAVITLRSGGDVKTKEEKKAEIITGYKELLKKSLHDFDKEDKMRKDKKIMLLREFSQELSMNIFFDKDEIKEIILELSAE